MYAYVYNLWISFYEAIICFVRFNGLVHNKSVGIEEAADGKGVVMVTKKPKRKTGLILYIAMYHRLLFFTFRDAMFDFCISTVSKKAISNCVTEELD